MAATKRFNIAINVSFAGAGGAEAQAAFRGLVADASKASNAVSDLASHVKQAFVGFMSYQAVKGFLTEAYDAGVELRQGIAQLEAGLKSTGSAVGYTGRQLSEMADRLEDVSTADDGAIRSALAVLLTFTRLGHEVFPQAAKAALDLSARLGTDLDSAAVMLGKALQDPIAGVTSLRKVGISLSESQKDLIAKLMKTGDVAGAQAVIIKELNVEVGGSAEAARKAAGGMYDLKKAYEDNVKAAGTALLPMFDDIGHAMSSFLVDNDTLVGRIGATYNQWRANANELAGGMVEAWAGIRVAVVSSVADIVAKVVSTAQGAPKILRSMFGVNDAVVKWADGWVAEARRWSRETVASADALASSFYEIADDYRNAGTAAAEMAAKQDALAASAAALAAAKAKEAAAAEAAADAARKDAEAGDALADRLVYGRKAAKDWTEQQRQLNAAFDAGAISLDQYAEAIRAAYSAAVSGGGIGNLPRPGAPFGDRQGNTDVVALPGTSPEALKAAQERVKQAAGEIVAGLNAAYAEGDAEAEQQATEHAQRARQAWVDAAFTIGDSLAQMFERGQPGLAKLIRSAEDFASAMFAAYHAQNKGEAAMAGAGVGSSLYGAGLFGDAGRGQTSFGGTHSGNYSDVGSTVGGAIGAVIGTYFGPAGTAVGAMLGGLIGGVIGSAIKAGADEGLASLRQVGNEVSVRITKDEGGIGGVLSGVGRNIVSGLKQALAAIGGQLNSLAGGLDLKIRDDELIVFVNGMRRVFKDTGEAVNFAIGELLRTADISGLSDNARAVLDHSRQQQGGANADSLLNDLGFAQQMDRMNLGPVGQAIARLGDQARVVTGRILELGLSSETLAAWIAKVNEGWQAARRALVDELATLTGTSTAGSAVVRQFTDRVAAWVKGARELTAAAAADAAQRPARIAFLRQEMEAQQRLAESARARLEEAIAANRGPRDGSGDIPENAQEIANLRNEARLAEEALRNLGVELSSLQQQSDQASIDVNTAISQIIASSANLFRDFTDQWLAGPAEVFARQIAQFADYRTAAQQLLDSNLALAETDEQRAAAQEVFRQQLAELAAAEEAFRTSTAQQTLADIAQRLGEALGDQRLLGEAERLRHLMTVANYRIQLEVLRATGRVSEELLAYIEGAIDRFEGQDPGQAGGGGKGGGGGRRDAKKNLLDQLAEAQKPVLTGWAAQLDDINRKIKAWTEEAKKLGISLDEVAKAGAALKAKLRADIMDALQGIVGGRTSVGDAIAKILKERDDLLKVAKDLHIPLGLIQRAFRQQLREITAGVMADVRSYKNVYGQMDLGLALLANKDQAEKLRKELLELQKVGVDVTGALADIELAEKQRAQLLRDQAKLGFLQGISEWVTDEKLALELRKAEAALQLQTLRATLTGLLAQGDLTDAQKAQYRQWLADAQKAIDVYINTGVKPGDTPANDNGTGTGGAGDGRGAIGDLRNQIDDIFDRSGGLQSGFRDLRARSAELAKQLTASGMPTDQLRRELARLTEQEKAAREQMGKGAVADLFERVASYMADGAEKEAFLKTAAEIRWQLELANMQMQLEFLHAEGFLLDDNYNKLKKAIESLPDLPNYTAPSGPGSGGGGGSSQFDDAQSLIDSLRAMLHSDLPDVARRFADLDSEFERIRQQAADLNLDRLLGPGGGEQLISEAYASRVRALWDEILSPLQDFLDGLNLSELSPLTARQRIDQALAQAQQVAAAAMGGDVEAQAQFAQIAQQLLQEATALGTAGSEYGSIFAWVQQMGQQILGMHGMGTGATGAPPSSAADTLARLLGSGSNVLAFPDGGAVGGAQQAAILQAIRAGGGTGAPSMAEVSRVFESGFAVLHGDNIRRERLLERIEANTANDRAADRWRAAGPQSGLVRRPA